MSITSKSPTKVAAVAYEAGKKALPDYAHKYSRQDFTCAQLVAILVLRKFFKQDYRTTIAFICEWSDLRDILDIVVDCKSHIILSHVCGQGPRPDVDQLLPLMENMTGQVAPDQLLLDAGYDSEQNLEMLREYLGIESVIPAKIGRPTNKLPKGKWRRLMATNFDDESYGQRWQVETVMHMLKSRLGDALTARTYHARNREMGLMSLAHNLMIVRRIRGFLQSRPVPI